jgi:hypothetical protein
MTQTVVAVGLRPGSGPNRHNLACLCRPHHRMVHEGGYTMTTATAGQFQFHRPDGTAITTTAPTHVHAGDDTIRQHDTVYSHTPM